MRKKIWLTSNLRAMLYTQESRLMATQNVTPYIHTTANNHKIRTNYLVPDNEPWNLSKIKINWNTLSTVFLLLCMWIYVCCYCCSTASDPEVCTGNSLNLFCSLLIIPGTVYWEQAQVSFLFPEQEIRNRQENLLFPISYFRNAVPGTEEVHQTYLLQFRSRVGLAWLTNIIANISPCLGFGWGLWLILA